MNQHSICLLLECRLDSRPINDVLAVRLNDDLDATTGNEGKEFPHPALRAGVEVGFGVFND